jgi:uncharacterized protein (UPF0147 family)
MRDGLLKDLRNPARGGGSDAYEAAIEIEKLAETAHTMLTALIEVANDPDTPADLRGMAFAVIAHAEAAGIKATEAED